MSEENKINRHETWITIIMSLSALLTAWCAYQANLWTGSQELSHVTAQENEILATREYLNKNAHHMSDSIMSGILIESLAEGRKEAVDFFVSRVHPELRTTFEAWLKTDPLNNPNAISNPLLMPIYKDTVLKNFIERERKFHALMVEEHKKARKAGRQSDNYILFTVILATVLFFGGISSTLQVQRVQMVLLVVTTIIFIGTAIAITLSPIAT